MMIRTKVTYLFLKKKLTLTRSVFVADENGNGDYNNCYSLFVTMTAASKHHRASALAAADLPLPSINASALR